MMLAVVPLNVVFWVTPALVINVHCDEVFKFAPVPASGDGQVVDAAITDGAALLTTIFHALKSARVWQGPGHPHVLDSSAPFYDTFRCADGKWISIEVRYVSGKLCDPGHKWTVAVSGHT